jgi:hypothetical protein
MTQKQRTLPIHFRVLCVFCEQRFMVPISLGQIRDETFVVARQVFYMPAEYAE